MTDLIPRDAAIAAVREYIKDTGSELEKWDVDQILHAIPAIDPAAIREAALREAVKSLRIWHALAHNLYPNSATTVGMAADVVEALIGEKK